MSEAKIQLSVLEKEEKYVFHGSDLPDIQELEPRQAFTYHDGKRTEDGLPAVAATPFPEIAIFRSLIKGKSGFGNDGNKLFFEASKISLEESKNRTGYVYVLSRDEFHPKKGNILSMDWRSEQKVKPIKMFKVSFRDLPEEIKIIE